MWSKRLAIWCNRFQLARSTDTDTRRARSIEQGGRMPNDDRPDYFAVAPSIEEYCTARDQG